MSWKVVCRTSEVSVGGMEQFDVDGIAVLVVNSQGQFFAYPPLCPHMEEPLVGGLCDGKRITCTKHLWQWDIRSGTPLGPAETPLLMYETKVEGDDVLIFIEQELTYEYS